MNRSPPARAVSIANAPCFFAAAPYRYHEVGSQADGWSCSARESLASRPPTELRLGAATTSPRVRGERLPGQLLPERVQPRHADQSTSWHGMGPWYHNVLYHNVFDVMKEIPYDEKGQCLRQGVVSSRFDFRASRPTTRRRRSTAASVVNVRGLFRFTLLDTSRWSWLTLQDVDVAPQERGRLRHRQRRRGVPIHSEPDGLAVMVQRVSSREAACSPTLAFPLHRASGLFAWQLFNPPLAFTTALTSRRRRGSTEPGPAGRSSVVRAARCGSTSGSATSRGSAFISRGSSRSTRLKFDGEMVTGGAGSPRGTASTGTCTSSPPTRSPPAEISRPDTAARSHRPDPQPPAPRRRRPAHAGLVPPGVRRLDPLARPPDGDHRRRLGVQPHAIRGGAGLALRREPRRRDRVPLDRDGHAWPHGPAGSTVCRW